MAEKTRRNTSRSAISPADARRALDALIACSRPGAAYASNDDALLVWEVGMEWLAWRSSSLGQGLGRCCACHAATVRPPYVTDHYPYCDLHPAYTRLRAALDALDLAPAVAAALWGNPPPPRPRPASLAKALGLRADEDEPERPWIRGSEEEEIEDTVKALLYRKHDPSLPDPGQAAQKLQEILLEWTRAYHRDTDPCPHCGAVLPLPTAKDHLLSCEAHPANGAAEEISSQLSRALGPHAATELLAFTGTRSKLREMLLALWWACNIYENDMGWSEGDSYSKPWAERPWRDARAAAEALLGQVPVPERPELPWRDGVPPAAVEALHAEAVRLREALSDLCAACATFWNRMGDGHGGRSVIPDSLFPPWKEARAVAKAALLAGQPEGAGDGTPVV